MSTQRRNSAIFAEVSGPHCCPYPWNAAYQTGVAGLGAYQNPVPGGNYSDYTGLMQSPGWHLQPGQVGRFILVTQGGLLPAREVLEAALEGRGIWTRTLWIQQGSEQATWIVGPRDRRMTSDEIVAQMLSVLGTRALVYMPAPPEWATYYDMRQGTGRLSGLGDIFQALAGRGLRVSADLVCSPAFQAAAAQSIAERYGEEQARQFREHLRAATPFCRPGALERQQATREAEDQRKAYWAAGLVLGALGGLYLWHKLGTKGNRKRKRNAKKGRTFEVGDRVGYTRLFLKSIGMGATAPEWRWKGTIVQLGKGGLPADQFSVVRWDHDGRETLINNFNIAKIGSYAYAHGG